MTDRSVIYDAANDRYMGVHPWRQKGKTPKWRAALSVNGTLVELAAYRTREEAADRIVQYFKERYGRNWVRVVKARDGETFRHVSRIRKTGGAYTADVWLTGTTVVATPALVRDRTGAAGKGWATKADARRAVSEIKARLSRAADKLQRPQVLRWTPAV